MAFELLNARLIYKEEVSYTEPYWRRGVFYEGGETITYTNIEGFVEPHGSGESAVVLPAGVSSSDAKVLYTESQLQSYLDFDGDASMADRIYLTDPRVGKDMKHTYVVYEKEDWQVPEGFTLLNSTGSYILIREGKL